MILRLLILGLRIRSTRAIVVDLAVLWSQPSRAAVGRNTALPSALCSEAREDEEQCEDEDDYAGEEDPSTPAVPAGVAVAARPMLALVS